MRNGRALHRKTGYTIHVLQSRVKGLVNLGLARRDRMQWPVYPMQRGIEAVAQEKYIKERIRSKTLVDYAVHDQTLSSAGEASNVEKPPDILSEEGLLDEDGALDPWALLREKDRRIAELILDNQQLEEEANQLFIEKVKADWREANKTE